MKTTLFSPALKRKTLDRDVFLYNSWDHLQTQTDQPIQTFILYRNKRPMAFLHFVVDKDQRWISPPKAPFGSVEYNKDCSIAEIDFFLSSIIEIMRDHGAKSLKIIHFPECYLLGQKDIVSKSFLTHGFDQIRQRNYHIPVSVKLFEENIVTAEKRRLKKCLTAQFKCERDAVRDVSIIYNFLYTCRCTKLYTLSLNETQLRKLFVACPNDVSVFTVHDRDRLIALSVTVRVHKKIVYNFLTDSLPEYRVFSPTVLLIKSIYGFCQQQDIAILDLGTALDHEGNEKPGLVRFKENIGGISSYKVSYIRKI